VTIHASGIFKPKRKSPNAFLCQGIFGISKLGNQPYLLSPNRTAMNSPTANNQYSLWVSTNVFINTRWRIQKNFGGRPEREKPRNTSVYGALTVV